MRIPTFTGGIFLTMMVLTTIGCTVIWESVAADHYDCTDDCLPGYWTPGCWVHAWQGHPVLAVPRVVHGRAMREPDAVDENWGMKGLWLLWAALFSGSIALSAITTRLTERGHRRLNTSSGERSCAPVLAAVALVPLLLAKLFFAVVRSVVTRLRNVHIAARRILFFNA